MPTMSRPSHATTVLLSGIADRQAVIESGCTNPPKLVAPNNAIACQSASVAVRRFSDEASTEFDSATRYV
jgi:hypothetical protein